MSNNKGYDNTMKGVIVNNQPEELEHTGNYSIDFMGCHWECKDLSNGSTQYIVGEYPNNYRGVE